MKDTEKLQQDVVAELAWDPRVDSSEISITASGDGVITLAGEVPTYRVKKAAERAAKRVEGVKAVADDIEVRLIREHRRDDTRLAEAAVRALKWHSGVPPEEVKVTVDDGWITLEGVVPWEYQRREAHDAVRDLTGVVGVTNEIKLETTAARPEDVHAKIEDAFKRSAEIDADNVHVDVSRGTIALSGEVSSWKEREDAERVAWFAPGVTDVKNRIRVKEGALQA